MLTTTIATSQNWKNNSLVQTFKPTTIQIRNVLQNYKNINSQVVIVTPDEYSSKYTKTTLFTRLHSNNTLVASTLIKLFIKNLK